MAERFVRPKTTKIDLSDGDWILVRNRLTAGERRESYDRMYLRNPDGSYVAGADGRLTPHPPLIEIANVTAYLIDWSFTMDGKPVVILNQPMDVLTAAVNSLDEDDFSEMLTAVEQHRKAMRAERDREKKTRNSERPSSAISPSPDISAAPTSGLPN